MNLLLFGTSITWGAWDDQGGWAQRIKAFADKKAISQDFENYTSVYCLGVSGDDTKDLLERFDAEIKARVDADEETILLVEIGINDSQYILTTKEHKVSKDTYKQNLLTLIEIANHYNATVVFIGLTPVDDSKVNPIPWKPESAYRLEFVQEYEAIVKNVCKENNVAFIEVMSDFVNNSYVDLLADGLHPNSKGHEIMFEKVKAHLINVGLL